MSNEELQIENGNYTRIVNKVIEELVKVPLLGAEYAVCIFVIRKTYGFNKTEDEISLTQFEEALKRSRPTIVKALKNLQLVNILKLVKKGDSRKQSNVWAFNKYYTTWKLGKTPKLVKSRDTTSKVNERTSKENTLQLVKVPKHTKETKYNTKDNTQKTSEVSTSQGKEVNELIELWKPVNPFYEEFYKNTTERKAMEYLLSRIGFEKLSHTIQALPEITSRKYAPKITKPTELRRDFTKLLLFVKQEQKGNTSIIKIR